MSTYLNLEGKQGEIMNREEVHKLIDNWFNTGKVKKHNSFKARLAPNEKEIRISIDET